MPSLKLTFKLAVYLGEELTNDFNQSFEFLGNTKNSGKATVKLGPLIIFSH